MCACRAFAGADERLNFRQLDSRPLDSTPTSLDVIPRGAVALGRHPTGLAEKPRTLLHGTRCLRTSPH
eukprot:CAMPEP_0173409738 /NCGR_PEP_ID=MMETSP1356-20130122/72928_1 /TAXON_ID=77927 ORGANISM="Hemiselmis virescens, Strain PCC157" /NCGR_SAMPLE_ID=MMETSP1356 /ASSEMBLY_ACC=CAM_ASM_000847 /LENGTH=67 /DNA_ID=CAMNT_0014371267 /DNA_START=13 /DNA_END=213 /DNA_ORIENTATION=+